MAHCPAGSGHHTVVIYTDQPICQQQTYKVTFLPHSDARVLNLSRLSFTYLHTACECM